MAVIRCSNCNVPLTEDEASAGKCPLCKTRIAQSEKKVPSRSAADCAAGASGSKNKMNGGMKIGMMVGAVIYAILMAGPLRNSGLLPTFVVGFLIFLVTGTIGKALGGVAARTAA